MRIVKSIEFWFANFLIVLLLLHDFIFLGVYQMFGSYFYINMWKEIIFLSFFFVWLGWGLYNRWVSRVWLMLVFIFTAMLLTFVFFGDMSEASLRTLRSFFMPVLFAIMLSRLTLALDSFQVSRLIDNVILVGFFSCCYAAYQYFFYKEMADFWYVAPLVAQGFDIVEHNSFRNGAVRISGFFTSSLEFSFYILLNLILLVSRNRFRRSLSASQGEGGYKVFSSLFVLVFVVAICFSTVRSAQVGLIVSLVYYFFVVKFKGVRPAYLFSVGFLLSVSLVALTFSYIYFGYTTDLSVLGRVKQWSEVVTRLIENPLGMGLGFIGPGQDKWYDSLLLNMLSALGFVAVIFFVLITYCYYVSCVLYSKFVEAGNYVGCTLALTVVTFFPVFIYLCFFQALYNAQVLYLFFAFMFALFFGIRKCNDGL
ncbi:MAG: hypothetical protein KJ930_08110 [Gammaproteobacteria bacterium]|nr:hypothetical protein [Gammaproteobacteria bacterium]MBU2064339.1 hypothetical protein [Gammaproteobacteria bacterium]MBU2179385.1 hypothetical protein [Gammaproteobacteria bacterium]MBU2255559.1 hypothetical protein [Gammaproteobacteria bacterium]